MEFFDQIKVNDSFYDLFKSYLTNSKICTVLDGSKSEVLDITAGVPQGACLGPLLWIIFMNDILDDLESEVLLLVDDTCLFYSGEDPAITAKKY